MTLAADGAGDAGVAEPLLAAEEGAFGAVGVRCEVVTWLIMPVTATTSAAGLRW